MKPAAIIFILFFIIGLLSHGAIESYAAHDLFEKLDKDRDSKVELREFSDDMKEQAFERIDTNRDKAVSLQEWESIGNIADPGKHSELFKKIDRDSDRIISFFEFSDYADNNANILEAFMGLDADGSNSLSPDEITVRPLFKMITIDFGWK